MESLERYRAYLGQTIDVTVDRPLGSQHPDYGFIYPKNYGYLAGTRAGDGHEIDCYILGIDQPIAHYRGQCIAVIQRHNDVEHKLIVARQPLSVETIRRDTHFVEQYFEIDVHVINEK